MTDATPLETVRNGQVVDGPWNYRQVTVLNPTWAKHDHYKDFGWPEPGMITFNDCYEMYCRNGIGTAVVDKTIAKTWETHPFLLEKPRDGSAAGKRSKETPLESAIRQHLSSIRGWQSLMDADRRSEVGRYAGAILRIGDDQDWDKPVGRVRGGIKALAEIIPAWEGQLAVSQWDTNERTPDGKPNPNYGKPAMFQFNEQAIGEVVNGAGRCLMIHPDRVVVWSANGTVHNRLGLESVFNALINGAKISGAGGEGFYKNARNNPVVSAQKDARLDLMAKAYGMTLEQLNDAMSDQVAKWTRGFDYGLFLQGMDAKALSVTLPSPEHFYNITLQEVSAAKRIPLKILVGSQSGERASTEDSNEWGQTNNGRRMNETVPNIMSLVNRFVRFGMLPARDWSVFWTDLTEASMSEKIDRVGKMAEANAKLQAAGEFYFTPEEVRAVVDLEPLSEEESKVDTTDTEDEADATLGAGDKTP